MSTPEGGEGSFLRGGRLFSLRGSQESRRIEILKEIEGEGRMLGLMRLRRIVGLVAVLGLAACGGNQGESVPAGEESAAPQGEHAPSHTDISVEQLREMMANRDFVLVNVHIPFEGDIPGTDESIRFDEIADNLDKLPQDRDAKIVLYCRSGRMSAEAGAVLASLGYTNVFNLVGGFRAWEAAGYEIEGNSGPT